MTSLVKSVSDFVWYAKIRSNPTQSALQTWPSLVRTIKSDKLTAMYSSKQISTLLNITGETVRARSEEFAEFLSHLANPGTKRQRQFNESDLQVMVLVNDMKNTGARFADIHLALKNGQRGALPDAAATSAIATQERGRVAVLQNQLAEWQALATQETNGRLEAEANVRLLKEQLAEAQAKIDRLVGENAVLKSKAGE
jgi:DNA-binding transcriptional MerR regulator